VEETEYQKKRKGMGGEKGHQSSGRKKDRESKATKKTGVRLRGTLERVGGSGKGVSPSKNRCGRTPTSSGEEDVHATSGGRDYRRWKKGAKRVKRKVLPLQETANGKSLFGRP